MSLFVKICGLTAADTVAAAVAAGADAVGFVFADSPRRISIERAREITRGLPARVIRVAVMRHPTQAEVDEVLAAFAPDWLQTDAADFARLDISPGIVPLPVFRDAPMLDAAALAAAPRVLFEAPVSGAGQRADWVRAAELARSTRLVLAGGLDPANVAAAIRQVAPWGVDVSSGVEARRGVKDRDKIAAFIKAVRRVSRGSGETDAG